uniref:Craniofacial development protein 2 n=1 Tax=Cacopsylla melanoneura TaxID=428564 RepID=A0A8D8U6H3_9HEMI
MRCDVASPGLTTTLSILVARDHFQLSRNMAVPLIKFSGVCPHSDLRVDTFGGVTCTLGARNEEVVAKKKKEELMKIATWNVRTMNKDSKLENLKREMKKNNIDVMGLSEVRWTGEGELDTEEYRMVYKGGEKKEKGVGFIYKMSLNPCVQKVIPKSDRVIALKLKSIPVDTLIIQVYMPTSEATDEIVEEIYRQIEEILEENGRGQIRTIVMGDWNSVVGDENVDGIVGKFGYGKKNDRGERLIEFCKQYGLWISNTWFKQHKRRLYTWKSPGDRMRYQIDYIMINERFKNSIMKAKTYPGADMDTDHNLLAAVVRTKMKHVKQKSSTRKWNTDKLRTEDAEPYRNEIEETMKNNAPKDDVKEEWKSVKDVILNSLEKNIGRKARPTKKDWITQEMLEKMEERRKWKCDSSENGRRQYRKLNNELRRETDKAREIWMEEQCEKIEELERYSKIEEMYRVVKNLTTKKAKTISKQGMRRKDGRVTSSEEENKEIWVEYIKELYDSEANERMDEMESQEECDQNRIGTEIEEWEVKKALKELKYNKALGCDNIPSEALKALGPCALARMTHIINRIYDTGTWPEDLLKTILLPLPKKPNATECKDYRTISFICHLTKTITRIMIKRIEKKVEENIGEDQFGFRKGKGTRDANDV